MQCESCLLGGGVGAWDMHSATSTQARPCYFVAVAGVPSILLLTGR
jgi:hypothetical protein